MIGPYSKGKMCQLSAAKHARACPSIAQYASNPQLVLIELSSIFSGHKVCALHGARCDVSVPRVNEYLGQARLG